MLIKRVRLRNIRSYIDETIEIPEGSVLLAGDIGSGKSSVLLGIDFALFGLRRGELSGGSLLRHGKNEGSVELEADIDGQNVVVCRSLKRGGAGVNQDRCWLELDGIKTDLSPTELRSKMIGLLGYPEAETSGRNLIYRYTVYTPQEQMQEILLGDAEERLNVMRKVFDIDKYERISSNASILLKELRARKRALLEVVKDEPTKRVELDSILKEKEAGGKSLSKTQASIKRVEEEIKGARKSADAMQIAIDKLNSKKQELKGIKEMHASVKERIANLKERTAQLRGSITESERQMAKLPKAAEFKSLKEIDDSLTTADEEKTALLTRKSHYFNEISTLQNIYKKGKCDVCRQRVSNPEEFKQDIENKMSELADVEKSLSVVLTKVENLKKMRIRTEQIQVASKDKERYEELIARDKKELEKSKNESDKLTEENSEREKKAKELWSDIRGADELAAKHRAIKQSLDKFIEEKESLLKDCASQEQRLKDIESRVKNLRDELKLRERQKDQIKSYASFEAWLNELFIKLMGTIENHIMVNIQQEFNLIFQQLFGILVPDENLRVEVDESFTPRILQNGYSTEYTFLSGGEKTATSLAYRLALNRVINDLIEGIKTKELIILDEPTDGFSSEQMESLRDVLRELNNRQTVVVSHEAKIEAFVDHIIRFRKENHLSKII